MKNFPFFGEEKSHIDYIIIPSNARRIFFAFGRFITDDFSKVPAKDTGDLLRDDYSTCRARFRWSIVFVRVCDDGNRDFSPRPGVIQFWSSRLFAQKSDLTGTTLSTVKPCMRNKCIGTKLEHFAREVGFIVWNFFAQSANAFCTTVCVYIYIPLCRKISVTFGLNCLLRDCNEQNARQ